MKILGIIALIIIGPYVLATIGGIIWGIIEEFTKRITDEKDSIFTRFNVSIFLRLGTKCRLENLYPQSK